MSEQAAEPAMNGMMRLRVRNSLKLWHLEAAVSTSQATLTSGAFQIGFAIYLQCKPFAIGVLAAIPAFVGLLQLLAPYLKASLKSRKAFISTFALASRLLWIPMLLIPFVLPQSQWVGSFLVLTLLSSALIAAPTALWVDWISDLVPPDARGRYFGMRNLFGGITGMVVSIVGGFLLDHITRVDHWPKQDAFGVLFGASIVFALAGFACAWMSPDFSDPSKAKPPPSNLLATFLGPFKNARFRDLTIFGLVTTVSQGIAGQFFLVYMIDRQSLALTYTAVQALNAVSSLATFFSMPLWGYLSDKYGNKPILVISVILVILPPFLWCLTSPDAYAGLWSISDTGVVSFSASKFIIIFLNVLAGLGWSGVALASFNMLIGIAPDDERPAYYASGSAVGGIVGGISPLIGGAILVHAMHWHYPHTGFVRNGYHFLFVISGVLRVVMLWAALAVRDPHARSTRYVIGQLTASPPLSSFHAIQQLEKAPDSRKRTKAAAELGRLKTPVAVEELVKALDDVSLPVREQAASSLGQIGDSRAVAPLVTKLTDPGSGIAELAAVALGKIGDQSALPALAAAVQLEGPPMRRLAAIEALGLLPDPRAALVLAPLIGDREAPIRAAAVRALMARESVVRRADITAALVEQWRVERDVSVLPVLADALAATHRSELAPELIEGYERLVSPILQREVLNTVGSLLGGRDSFYAYLALGRDAREDTVRKILTGLERAYRQPPPSGHPRVAARLRQAQDAYLLSDYSLAAIRVGQAAKLLQLSDDHAIDHPSAEPALAVISALRKRAESGAPVSAEEVLLTVFLLRLVSGR